MSEELCTISLQNLSDIIRLVNESSRGTSLTSDLDLISFLSLWRYWNFSCQYSLIRYVNGEPAALVLNCADRESHDAYTFHWGALRKFRSRRLALDLMDACCEKLRDDGYTTLYGDSIPDRPVRRYRFVQGHPQHDLVELQATHPSVPAAQPPYEIRPTEIGTLSQAPLPSCAPVHWCHRHSFLESAAPFMNFFGAFSGGALHAYAAVLTSPSSTVIVDIRSPRSCLSAGHELLRFLFQTYRAPFTANFVFVRSYAHQLLTASGFGVTRHFFMLSRDLRATRPMTASPA